MKTRNLIITLFCCISFSCGKVDNILTEVPLVSSNKEKGGFTLSSPTASVTVKVTTYNILSEKYDYKFPNNTWASRKAAWKDIIKQSNNVPEILGIQEGQEIDQVNDVITAMG